MPEENVEGRVLSLVERLREIAHNEHAPRYDGIYPIFEGKALGVAAQIFDAGVVYSLVDYIPRGVEMPLPNNLLSLVLDKKRLKEADAEMARTIVQRAMVPLPLHPEVLRGAEVKTYISLIEDLKVFTFEVVKGRSQADGDPLSFMSELGGTPYTGFKYMRVIH